MFRTLDLSTSGLVAQRTRMDTIAGNIANLNTTRDETGQVSPFQRRFITFLAADEKGDEGRGTGVKFAVHVDRETPPRKVVQPGHPDADASGVVSYPSIDLTKEFVNALEASRAYEANVATIDITKGMFSESLKILA
ncbi:MAG TPA: flagellar basal body rod protein FlgC [Planctomycetaceae bacterium]